MLLIVRQHLPVKFSAVAPAAYGVHAPIVKDSGTSVSAAESFAVHPQLAELLSEINHHGIYIHTSRYDEGGNGFTRIACKEIGSDTLFIVVFQKIQHSLFYPAQALPYPCNGGSGFVAANYCTKCVIQSHFIIEIIKFSTKQIITVFFRIIHFGNKE